MSTPNELSAISEGSQRRRAFVRGPARWFEDSALPEPDRNVLHRAHAAAAVTPVLGESRSGPGIFETSRRLSERIRHNLIPTIAYEAPLAGCWHRTARPSITASHVRPHRRPNPKTADGWTTRSLSDFSAHALSLLSTMRAIDATELAAPPVRQSFPLRARDDLPR